MEDCHVICEALSEQHESRISQIGRPEVKVAEDLACLEELVKLGDGFDADFILRHVLNVANVERD